MAIALAKHFDTEIVSADSRQVYREMQIGTAVPEESELRAVPHHFIQSHSIHDDYSAGLYEADAIALLDRLFEKHPVVVMVGGSGLYIKAVTHGLDEHPSDLAIRENLIEQYNKSGIEHLQKMLEALDPRTHQRIDLHNHQRVIRALEVCKASGKPYSSFLTHHQKARNFNTVAIGLNLPRPMLYERINRRVDLMVQSGLIEEAQRLYPNKNLNALQTVGYKELFSAFDGEISIETAIENIKTNTRRFAKRQITWFNKNIDAQWFEPDDETAIISYISEQLAQQQA